MNKSLAYKIPRQAAIQMEVSGLLQMPVAQMLNYRFLACSDESCGHSEPPETSALVTQMNERLATIDGLFHEVLDLLSERLTTLLPEEVEVTEEVPAHRDIPGSQ